MAKKQFTQFKITATYKSGDIVLCKTEPPHPKRSAKGLYPLHRVIMENHLGRYLERNEFVYHKDENKSNNDISNLGIGKESKKTKSIRLIASKTEMKFHCAYCKKEVTTTLALYNIRLKQSKNKLLYCSHGCSNKAHWGNKRTSLAVLNLKILFYTLLQ